MKAMMMACVNRMVVVALLLLAGICMPSVAQDKAGKEPSTKGAAGATKAGKDGKAGTDAGRPSGVAAADSGQGLGAFGKVLPMGQKNIDVKIPSFKDGLPSSTVRAGSMTRVDEENMAMEKMDIRLYGDPKSPDAKSRDVRVQLITANYHMPSQILTSDQRSRVSREDFDLQGDSMIFDTKTQQGKMVGNIHMVIYDSESMTPKPAGSPAPTGKNEPAPTAPNPEPTPPPANEKK